VLLSFPRIRKWACILALAPFIACAPHQAILVSAKPTQSKPALGPQAAFAARIPKPVAPFDTEAWYARQPKSFRDQRRIPLPGGRFMIGRAVYLSQDSTDALEKVWRDPHYLESISPAAADKIIMYAFVPFCRLEIQDTVVRIRYGRRSHWEGRPDTARAFLTRKEKESIDSAMADMPAGTYGSGLLIDCGWMEFYMSVYGIKRIAFGPCSWVVMAPDNPLDVLIPILRPMCRRQGIPDVTAGDDVPITDKELKNLDIR
jgi:hypothetical protein